MTQTPGPLRYHGGGYGGWLPGVPARDLSAEEVEQFGGMKALLAAGIYEPFTETKSDPGPSSNKALHGGRSNKSDSAADAPHDEAVQ